MRLLVIVAHFEQPAVEVGRIANQCAQLPALVNRHQVALLRVVECAEKEQFQARVEKGVVVAAGRLIVFPQGAQVVASLVESAASPCAPEKRINSKRLNSFSVKSRFGVAVPDTCDEQLGALEQATEIFVEPLRDFLHTEGFSNFVGASEGVFSQERVSSASRTSRSVRVGASGCTSSVRRM
ncbi:MAG: hypothetical protein KatS3mg020_0007 [Fimbriimonadales bacterium]|nr:MAG: hypothetical protein KatS3mg020_0007 [Fimbriimonadales bacterium]